VKVLFVRSKKQYGIKVEKKYFEISILSYKDSNPRPSDSADHWKDQITNTTFSAKMMESQDLKLKTLPRGKKDVCREKDEK